MAANQVDFKILPSDQFSVYSPATRSDKVITYFTLLSKLRGDILSVGQDDDPNNIVSAFYSSVGGTQTLHLVKADGSEVTASVPEPTVGTVTSVDLTASTGISVSGGPITTSGSITVTNTAPDQVVVLTGAGTTSISGTYPSFTITSNDQFVGTVTSVGLTMPAAFSVVNSPVTTSGTLAVTAAGLSSQYIRGDGQLANFPTPGGGGSSVNYYLNGSVSQGTFGGVTYYELSKVPIAGAGTNFTRAHGLGDGYIASFITDANDPDQINIPGGNFTLEFYFNSSSSGGSPAFYGELYKVSVSNVFTLIASGSVNPESITGGTTVDQYYTSIAVPQTALLSTDRLAIRVYVIVSGKDITLHTENSNFSEVITTFSTGLNSLNGLSDQVQYFAVGTSGTDFAISSSLDTHTFNLPTASATNRGALSSADWTTFNSKEPALTKGNLTESTSAVLTITGGTGAVIGTGTSIQVAQSGVSTSGFLSSTDWNTFNGKQSTLTFSAPLVNTSGTVSIPAATSLVDGYLSAANFVTFNGKQDALTLTTTGTTGAATLIGATLNIPNYADQFVGTVTSVNMSVPTGFAISGNPITTSGTLAVAFDTGYSLPTNASQTTWNTAYNDSITAFAYNTSTAVLTLTQQDAGTLTATVTLQPFSTSNLAEGTNLYYTDTRARLALSAGTGITYDSATGAITNNDRGSSQNIFKNIAVAGQSTIVADVNDDTLTVVAGSGVTITTNDTTDTITISATGSGGSVTSVGTSAPITGGTITTTGTIGITQSGAAADGYLSSTDWNTFNNKQNALTNPVTGTGTTNYVSKFTGTSAIGNSQIFDDGTSVGIGTAVPGQKLQVDGNIYVNDDGTTGNGIMLRGADRPLIARGWDPFTSGNKTGVGRWGVYMESAELFIGAPGTDYSNALITLGGWLVNGTRQPNLTLNNSTQRVGIGNTAPSEKLHVTGNIRVTGAYYDSSNAAGTSGQILSSTGTGTSWIAAPSGGGVTGSGTTNYVPKWTSASAIGDSAIYDSSGNVVIGSTVANPVASASPAALTLRKFTSGTASTVISSSYYLGVGGNEYTLNSYRLIGLGYSETSVSATYPAYIGYQEKSTAGYTFGDLIFGTRATTGGSDNPVERMRIANDGNVGIGTTGPTNKLHVASSTTFGTVSRVLKLDQAVSGGDTTQPTYYGSILLSGGGYNWGAIDTIQTNPSASWTSRMAFSTMPGGGDYNLYERMCITNGGNVGIGTSAPLDPLHISTSGADKFIRIENSNSYTGLWLNDGGSNSGWLVLSGYTDTLAAGDFAIREYGVQTSLTIKQSTGNVGIGTTGPSSKLHVSGNATDNVGLALFENTSSGGIYYPAATFINNNGDHSYGIVAGFKIGSGADRPSILFYNNAAAHSWTVGQVTFGWGNNDAFGIGYRASNDPNSFAAWPSNYFTILTSGNVGIGTTAPGEKLEISGSSNIYAKITSTTSGGNAGFRLVSTSKDYGIFTDEDLRFYDFSASSERMRITSAGNVGINNTNPSYKLDVTGDARINTGALGVNIAPSATDGRIDASNDIVAFSSSDLRLKENIKPIENALEKVKSLTGVEFDWKPELKHAHGYEGHDTGVIAQEVQEVMPTAIRTNDTGYLAVRYEKLIGLLIEANKELAARVEELESKFK